MPLEKLRPIAQSYWRLVKKNKKTFDGLDDNMKTLVRELAAADVVDGVITAEDYAQYLGEEYMA